MSKLTSSILSGGIALLARGLMTRDALLGRVARMPQDPSREDFYFLSGSRRLAAVWVQGPPCAPAILLCPGIGETVQHWGAVQRYLRERGVGSMICNYSGFGKSEGRISTGHCDQDFVSAYAELRRRVEPGTKVFVLGFSMGSGVAASGVSRLEPPPNGLFLCAGFTSFRDAMQAFWVPSWFTQILPNVWNTVEAVRSLRLPVCVVHSDSDELLPVEMARRVANAAACDLVVVQGLRHIEPYIRPSDLFWGPILDRVRRW